MPPRRVHRSLFGLMVAVACEQPAQAPPAATTTAPPASAAPRGAAVASLADVSTCTLETPLVPGVPGSPGHLVPDTVNPNGASELALLMRTLRADLATTRQQVLAGAVVRIPSVHHRIRCSWPTVPADRDARFDALAVGYLRAVDTFNRRGGRAEYQAVVEACIHCHQGACTGALAAIEPLALEGP